VAGMGRLKMSTGWWEKLKESNHLEEPGMDRRMILNRMGWRELDSSR